MPNPKIKTASPNEIDQCVALIVLAFGNDPAARWLYREPHAFLDHFPSFVRTFGGRAFEQGSAHYIEGCAAALWFPPGAEPDEDAVVALIKDSVPASDQDEVFELFERMEEVHPKEPHWYLPFIGTDPGQQASGFGSALLSHALEICDRQKTPSYLEATSPNSVRLYQRHGFEALPTIQVGGSPAITPMLRKAR